MQKGYGIECYGMEPVDLSFFPEMQKSFQLFLARNKKKKKCSYFSLLCDIVPLIYDMPSWSLQIIKLYMKKTMLENETNLWIYHHQHSDFLMFQQRQQHYHYLQLLIDFCDVLYSLVPTNLHCDKGHRACDKNCAAAIKIRKIITNLLTFV